ncbi:F-box protein [Phanerochaete sordida]|uniref:F-box protein n=1 Tax=Phanerochaete sordida TaxID=48140 RepID=A0A9P3G5I0_9APHY|nr:F-box protein [Phanerochaete sordida]
MKEAIPLPVELIDEIVGYAKLDRRSLQACASVCKAWNAVTRAHVFRRVKVDDEPKLSDLESLLQANPDIGLSVRELTFGPFTPTKTYRASIRWAVRIPQVLPPLLPLVQTIRFVRLSDAGEYCDAAFFRGFTAFASATRLVLDDSALNIPTLRAFACSLPRLQELVVLGMLPLMVTVWKAPPLVCRPRFTALMLDFAVQPSTTMADFLDWFQKSDARHTVRSLDLAVKVLDAKPVNSLLAAIGPTLEHLGLKLQALFSSSWEFDLIKGAVSIAPCRNLRSLRLFNPLTRAMVAFLKEVPPKNLHTLTFHVTLGKSFDTENPEGFELLAREIDSERYGDVETVHFVHDGFIPLSEVRKGLQKVFPALHKRKALHVSEEDRPCRK